MVRRSQTSNPRSVVVLTAGTDWGTRAAVQRRASEAEAPMPRKQTAKLKTLQHVIGTARTAINNKRWHQARYSLSQARALVNALPADQTKQEREQLSLLRKRYAARGTVAAKNAAKAKAKVAARAGGRKAAAKTVRKKTQAKTTQTPEPTPVPDLADRVINRAALGYAAPTDETRRPRSG